jgi:hypothetical protein
MNANDSLERRITDYYEREAPPRAPDWVLGTALETIDTTPQRRVLIPAPWRSRHMNSFAKLAIAAVVVIAVGVVGWNMFAPRSPSGVGSQPSVSPSPSASPSPPATPDPSAPPPLSETFTSTIHGIAMSYPAGWDTQPATEAWRAGVPNFREPAGDFIYHPTLLDHLFFVLLSRPLDGQAPEAWLDSIRSDPDGGCADPETVTIGASAGRVCPAIAYGAAGGRAYMIRLYTSGDEGWLERYYDQEWFKTVLETVQLDPEAAVDTPKAPSASPSS